MGKFQLKRIYDPPHPSDGVRVLVDRIWPRGVSKEQAALSFWMKDLAPSAELRRWFCHKPELFETFRERYLEELRSGEKQRLLHELLSLCAGADAVVTLLYGAADREHNQAVVLKEWLDQAALERRQDNRDKP
jgi:uncharacterized protein YeaO (DUF488 family)